MLTRSRIIRYRQGPLLGDVLNLPVFGPDGAPTPNGPPVAAAFFEPLSENQQWEQEEAAWDRADRVLARLQAWPAFADWQVVGRSELDHMLMATLGRRIVPLLPLPLLIDAVDDIEYEHLALLFRAMVDVVCGREYPMLVDGRLQSMTVCAAVRKHVNQRAAEWKLAVRYAQQRAGLPLDSWHQATTLSIWLSEELALHAVDYQWWLEPPPRGQTNRERQVATAVGSSDRTERAALQTKRAYLQLLGVERDGRTPGPKPGSTNRKSEVRLEFEQYVIGRNAAGVSAAMIAEDAEAAKRYRLYKGDHAARLTERIVGRVLRGHRRS